MSSPRISVITPVYRPVIKELEHCLKSAKADGVEHVLVADGLENLGNPSAVKRLALKYSAKLHVSPEQKGISAASNEAVEKSLGEFLVFLDQDDFLVKNWSKPLLASIDESDFVYSDCFIADEYGKPVHIFRKPSWSPVRLLFNMYAVHFMAIRKTLFVEIGGFRSEYDGSQDHDLAMRVSRVTDRVVHLPFPLYHWRQSKASTAANPENKRWAFDAGLAATKNQLGKLAPGSEVSTIEGFPGALRPKFAQRNQPVSVVIPSAFKETAPGTAYVDSLIKSLVPFLDTTLGDEIVIVHGDELESSYVLKLRAAKEFSIRLVKDTDRFSFSQRCNIGFEVATNEHILLLNDDIEFGADNPLDNLFGLLGLPNVGLVGGLLAFPDFSIQHGGHSFIDQNPHHVHYQSRSLSAGLMDLAVDHEVVGVTGALMFQLKSTWRAVGGFSSIFPLNYNDVDYCQKILTLGFTIIQANSVTAFHHESVTRDSVVEDRELELIRQRWPDAISSDTFSTI
jgi:GT2 family glycosyltransferase